MALTKEDTAIIEAASGYNVGDLGLNLRNERSGKLTRRSDVLNRHGLRANIFPDEVINRKYPTHNYSFAWVPFEDHNFYQDLRDEGYMPVTESEFVLNREGWEWYTPEKQVFRWSVTHMLTNRDEFLMYRNEELFQREQNRRLNLNQDNIEARYGQTTEDAARIAMDKLGVGIEVEGKIDGKTVASANGKRRTTNI